MSSLKISGWKDEDIRVELDEILATFGDMTIEGMNAMNREEIQSALSAVSLMYLSLPDNPYNFCKEENINKKAFLVGEILEYVQQQGFIYARNAIMRSLEQEAEDDERLYHAAQAIGRFYYDLFEKHGFENCRFTGSTWNSKHGNVTHFPELKIECYGNREVLEALVLANEIIRQPYDFLDASADSIMHGFGSISEYLAFLGKENFEEYMKSQLNRCLFVEYKAPKEQIVELLK